MPSISIMIPALNEERRIGLTLDTVVAVVGKIPGLTAQILVVDDGSTDDTAAVVSSRAQDQPYIRLLRHERNRGLGEALRTALREATGEKFLIVPGDNDMPAGTLADLLRQAHQADLAMCFFVNREQRGRMRNLLSTLFGLIYATTFDVYVQYLNGPCVYPAARLRELKLFSTRFSIVAEINVKLLRRGVTFLEIASYRQTGLDGSTSLTLRSLGETVSIFCRLCYEIHWQERRVYQHRPRRILPDTP